MVLGLVLAIIGTTSWAFYTRSHTGAFPQSIRKLVEAFHRIRLPQSAGSVSNQTTQKNAVNDPNHAAMTGGTQASGATNKADGVQTQAVPESSGASAAPSQEPVEGESSTGQPASDGAHVSAAATTSGPSTPGQAQALQSSGASGQPVVAPSPTGIRQNDKNQPATENARAPNAPPANGDSATPTVPSGADEREAAARPSPFKPVKKPGPEPALTVDGFSRHDVPELLRQADAAAERSDYRLARYEYNLILKLDPSNTMARASLHRVQAAEQSH